MTISTVLARKGSAVQTVPPRAAVRELLALLAEHRVGALVVSAGEGRVDGIVSERDVVRALAAQGPGLLDERVETIMTFPVRTCAPGDTVDAVMLLMTEQRIRHVPVVVAGRLAGIVSIGDVVKQRLDELQTERDQLSAYITS